MSAPIKLSIITVNLNNAAGLSKTLESVASQTFTNYEHIIIDGGSTDGSVDIIKEYERKYNGAPGHLYWVSEPDKGIYNAMNKGIKVASGEYCLFLNSGDWLLKNSIKDRIFSDHTSPDILSCDLQSSKGKISYPGKIDLLYLLFNTLGHPSTFIKKTIFEKYGLYNEQYTIISDWLFFFNAIINKKATHLHLTLTLTYFEDAGLSSDQKKILAEKENAFNTILTDYKSLYNQIIKQKRIIDIIKYSRIFIIPIAIYRLFHKQNNLNL